MRSITVLVAGLLLLQVEGNVHGEKGRIHKKLARKALRAPPVGLSRELSHYPPFFDHCEQIFKWNRLDLYIIKAIVDDIMTRLDTVCDIYDMKPLVPVIVAGNLFCGNNIPATTDILLEYVLDKVDRKCEKVKDFHSIYVSSD